jgi:hypothetical protein
MDGSLAAIGHECLDIYIHIQNLEDEISILLVKCKDGEVLLTLSIDNISAGTMGTMLHFALFSLKTVLGEVTYNQVEIRCISQQTIRRKV